MTKRKEKKKKKNNRKRKEKKRKINIGLAVLPSYDTISLSRFLVPRIFLQLILWVTNIAHLVVFFYLFPNSQLFLLLPLLLSLLFFFP